MTNKTLMFSLFLVVTILQSCYLHDPKSEVQYNYTGILKNKIVFDQCDNLSWTNGFEKTHTAFCQNQDVLLRDHPKQGKVVGRLKKSEKVAVTGWWWYEKPNTALVIKDTLLKKGGENRFQDSCFHLKKGKIISLDWIDTIESTCHIFFKIDTVSAIAIIKRDYIREIPKGMWFYVKTKNHTEGYVLGEFLKFTPELPPNSIY